MARSLGRTMAFGVSLAVLGACGDYGSTSYPVTPNEFGTFSPTKILAAGSNVMDVLVQVAGQPTPAQVTGFGAVFSDVDVANATTIEYLDASGVRHRRQQSVSRWVR